MPNKVPKPWDKPHANARKCKHCHSQRPGMQPLRLFRNDGTQERGYWHLKCFEIVKRKEERKKRTDAK